MDYKKYNDYELVYLVKENDDDSRDILFKKYSPVIKSIANEYYQHFKNYGYDFDDFLQEATISFEKALLTYDDSKDSLLYTFVILCIRRSMMSFCRNISGKKQMSSNVLIDIDECNVVDLKSDVYNFIESSEIDKLCKKFIFDISFEMSTVFELKLNGFSYKEISILLDIPISSIEFRIRKSKIQMRKILHDYLS